MRIRATNAAPHVTDCSRAAPASSRAALILSAWARGCRPVCHPLSATWPDRPAAERATRAASREPPPPRRRRRRRRRRHGRACHGRLPARLSRPVIVSGARLSRPHLGSTARHRAGRQWRGASAVGEECAAPSAPLQSAPPPAPCSMATGGRRGGLLHGTARHTARHGRGASVTPITRPPAPAGRPPVAGSDHELFDRGRPLILDMARSRRCSRARRVRHRCATPAQWQRLRSAVADLRAAPGRPAGGRRLQQPQGRSAGDHTVRA